MASIKRRETEDGTVRWRAQVFLGREPETEWEKTPDYAREQGRASQDESGLRYIVATGSGGGREEYSRHETLKEAESRVEQVVRGGEKEATIWVSSSFTVEEGAPIATVRRTGGKRKFLTKTFGRKKDAEKWARKKESLKDDGIRARPSKELLGEYLTRWLDAKEGTVRARTIADYRGNVRRYILEPPDELPPLKFIRLDRLTHDSFQQLYDAMWKELDLSPRTIRYLHTIVRMALKDAVKKGQLVRNPTDHVELKTQERGQSSDAGGAGQQHPGKAMRTMSEDEATRFLTAAKEDRYAALWIVLLTGGLRPGEALGLLWEDVDLEEGRLHVQRALTRRGVDRKEHPKGWKLVQPKTAKARRVVPLPPVAVKALREWRAAQGKERLKLGAEYEDNGLVFTTEFGKPLDPGNLYNRNFRPVMAQAKLGEWETVEVGDQVKEQKRRFNPAFRVYDLRHTCATLLLSKGESPKVVQERLGHKDISLTLNTYSHVLPDMQEGAAEKLEQMFGASG